jgi:hypothetical protein
MTENASFEKLTESSNIGQVRTRIRRIETRLKDKLHPRGWQSGRSILSSECIQDVGGRKIRGACSATQITNWACKLNLKSSQFRHFFYSTVK